MRPRTWGKAMSETAKAASSESVLLESASGGIVTLTMNRPEKLNAVNNDLAMALIDALSRLEHDPGVHVVLLTGAGRAFCAGGDLGAIAKGRQIGTTSSLEPLLRAGMQTVIKIRTIP